MSTSSRPPRSETPSTGKKSSTVSGLDPLADLQGLEWEQKDWDGNLVKVRIPDSLTLRERLKKPQISLNPLSPNQEEAWVNPNLTDEDLRNLLDYYSRVIAAGPIGKMTEVREGVWVFTPGSSPSTPGTTSPSTLTWRERSSYLTSRDWLGLETGPGSSSESPSTTDGSC